MRSLIALLSTTVLVNSAQAITCESLIETARSLFKVTYAMAALQEPVAQQCQSLKEGSFCVNTLKLVTEVGITLIQWQAGKEADEASPFRIICSALPQALNRQCFMVDYCVSWREAFDDERGWVLDQPK